ncbi:SHUGOSHIN 2-like [Rutidosis leptorrhynchoides]|uniref:SHUGOSHIN 2-like n=1 Tax=Rutidosis leptorrhynchoides TaxID=125765 RepID=UPI003A9A1359
MAKAHALGTNPRKRLADISNLAHQTRLSIQENKPCQNTTITAKEYIDKLQKDNASLMKLLADRNKLIELSGVELQKLKMNLQKVQLQNLQLAQSNTQMLSELNAGKDKLKAIQHELGCKNSLLKSMKFVSQEKACVPCQVSVNEVGSTKSDEVGESLPAEKEDNEMCKTNRRRQTRSQSLGPSTTKPCRTKETIDNKRRRQSARFTPVVQPETENLFEIDDAKMPVSLQNDEVNHENDPKLLNSSTKIEHETSENVSGEKSEDSRRSSVGRPSRRAAGKVLSYKERPINVKLRRD